MLSGWHIAEVDDIKAEKRAGLVCQLFDFPHVLADDFMNSYFVQFLFLLYVKNKSERSMGERCRREKKTGFLYGNRSGCSQKTYAGNQLRGGGK